MNSLKSVPIESMAFKGKGLARIDGCVYFIDGAIEGDIVDIEVTERKKSYAQAVATNLVHASPFRISAPCGYQSRCGGCPLMPMQYERQIFWKNAFVKDAFQKVAGLDSEEFLRVFGPLKTAAYPTHADFNYRNRIFLRARVQDGRLALGYTDRDHKSFVEIKECLVAAQEINKILRCLGLPTGNLPGVALPFRVQLQLLIDNSAKKIVTCAFYPSGNSSSEINSLCSALSRQVAEHCIDVVALLFNVKDNAKAPDFIYDSIDGLRLHTRPGVFQQVNKSINKQVIQDIRSLCVDAKIKSVLDLCCGSGNLSLLLAKDGIAVEGIESNRSAIELAKVNVERNQISCANYIAGDALHWIKNNNKQYDAIILDPPREGFKFGLVEIIEKNPRIIIYLSCDPFTLARDARVILQSGKYQIQQIHPYDMFPQTYHVETLMVLNKRT